MFLEWFLFRLKFEDRPLKASTKRATYFYSKIPDWIFGLKIVLLHLNCTHTFIWQANDNATVSKSLQWKVYAPTMGSLVDCTAKSALNLSVYCSLSCQMQKLHIKQAGGTIKSRVSLNTCPNLPASARILAQLTLAM